jgi:hypothetical protein
MDDRYINAAQTARDISEMIAQFRTPPGINWKPLADDIEIALAGREPLEARIAELEGALREVGMISLVSSTAPPINRKIAEVMERVMPGDLSKNV